MLKDDEIIKYDSEIMVEKTKCLRKCNGSNFCICIWIKLTQSILETVQ